MQVSVIVIAIAIVIVAIVIVIIIVINIINPVPVYSCIYSLICQSSSLFLIESQITPTFKKGPSAPPDFWLCAFAKVFEACRRQ